LYTNYFALAATAHSLANTAAEAAATALANANSLDAIAIIAATASTEAQNSWFAAQINN